MASSHRVSVVFLQICPGNKPLLDSYTAGVFLLLFLTVTFRYVLTDDLISLSLLDLSL